MGLKDIGKKIVGGVKKAFKKVVKVVGKFLNSKLGKAIMIAATVVTAGAALYGAYMGATGAISGLSGGNFLTTFGKGAMGALKGGMTGMRMANQAMGQALTGKFAAAGNTLGSIGSTAQSAGSALTKGLGEVAKTATTGPNVGDGAKSVVDSTGALKGEAVSGLKASTDSVGTFADESISGALKGQEAAVKAASEASMAGAKGASGSFTQKLVDAALSPEGLVALGKAGVGGAKAAASYFQAKDEREEQKDLYDTGIFGKKGGAGMDPMQYIGYDGGLLSLGRRDQMA